MASIDALFKKPNAPSTVVNGKRKFEHRDADQAYKSARLSTANDVKDHSNGYGIAEDTADDEDDDEEAGPELPPDDEADADEEGRFFGGGVTRDATDALDFLDATTETDLDNEVIDAPWVRRMILALQRKIALNAKQRAKFESEPAKFMQSEAELDAAIKTVSILTDHPDLYDVFVAAKGAEHLVSLLAHENTDIAINAIEIIAELIAEDVDVNQAQWDTVVTSMLDADLLGLLVQNFQRFDETNESDRLGLYHALAVLEALASQEPIAEITANDTILRYLLDRLKAQEPSVSQNKQYAAEVLQVLLQSSPAASARFLSIPSSLDTLLQTLALYRKQDPERDSNESQFAQDVFDATICLVSTPTGREQFSVAEGIELMIIMLREGERLARHSALKVLDHALSGIDQHALCPRFVASAGLKPLFAVFRKATKPLSTTASAASIDRDRAADVEHCLGLFASLLRSLPGGSEARIRLFAKFQETGCASVDALLGIRAKARARVSLVDKAIAEERRANPNAVEDRSGEWFSRRLDAGLYVAQTADIVLAWLVAENMARDKISGSLSRNGEALTTLKSSLEEQLGDIDDDADPTAAEVLRALVDCVV